MKISSPPLGKFSYFLDFSFFACPPAGFVLFVQWFAFFFFKTTNYALDLDAVLCMQVTFLSLLPRSLSE